MNIADQIMRRADRAFAETSGRILVEDLSLMERKAIEDDMEAKARYVRTPEGARRFKRPIGAIILPRGGSLDRIRIKDPVFKGFDLVEDRKGNLYDVGKDASTGKYVALKHNTWDDQVEPQDSLDKALEALNEKLGGGTNSDRVEDEKPAPKTKKPAPKKTPSKEQADHKRHIEEFDAAIAEADRLKGDKTAKDSEYRKAYGRLRRAMEAQENLRDTGDATPQGEARYKLAKRLSDDMARIANERNPNIKKPQGDAPASDDNVASSDPSKAVTRDTPIGTPVRVAREYSYPGKLNDVKGAVGKVVRRNKNGVTVDGPNGMFTAPYDALEVISQADMKRSAAARNASKDLDLLDRQAGDLQNTMGRMEKASTLDELTALDRDFNVQRARQSVKANEIIKNPRTSDEDRKRAEKAQARLKDLDNRQLALLERKKAELSAPKAASKGAQGSPERDAFIESHPKIKDVPAHNKPKLRDMSEKNFEAYVDAVEGGKSPNSIGAIMDRVAPGSSWNPITEKWSGQDGKKRPTSPTPTGDTSASDAADAAVRDRVQKMKDADRSKGRTNPFTNYLNARQKAEVDALTPGEYATYMNRRDQGLHHGGAIAAAKGREVPAKPKTPEKSNDQYAREAAPKILEKHRADVHGDLAEMKRVLEEGYTSKKPIAERIADLTKLRNRLGDTIRRIDLSRKSNDSAHLKRERDMLQPQFDMLGTRIEDLKKRQDAGEPKVGQQYTNPKNIGTTTHAGKPDAPSGRQMGAQEKRSHDRSVKDFDKAQTAARNLSQGPDVEANLRRYTAARDGLDRAIREYEVARKTGYGVSPETERRYADSRSLRDTLDARLKGFREQRAQEQADLKRAQEAERQRAQAEQAAADERRASERRERFEAREREIAQSEKYGNERQMIESNDEHLQNIVEAGRAGNAESLRAETEERIAEIKKRLALDDRTLGGYHMGKGGAEADRDGAQHRARLTGQMGSFEQALKIMDRMKSNEEAEQEREERRNRAPVPVPQDFDAQKRVMDRKYEALRKEISDFERTGGTQAWLNKVATVERLTALQKKVRDLRAEADRVLDPKTSTSMSADYSKERLLKDLDHRANMLQLSLDRSKASERAKERARTKVETPTVAERQDTGPKPSVPEAPAPTLERVKGTDSALSEAKKNALKARRARTEKSARDAINALNGSERDLNRSLEFSGDRMPADQRAEVEETLKQIRAARSKAEENIPLSQRTHLRPQDLPALREEAESRRYTIPNPRVNDAVKLFNEIPSGTDLPYGRRNEQAVDMDDVYAMDNPPTVPELNRAIDALEKEGDGGYDDELWVLRTVRNAMKEKIDRERAEFEASNTSLFGDDLSIPEPTPARQSASSSAPSPVALADVKWTRDDSKTSSYIKAFSSAKVNGNTVELRQEGNLNTYVVSVKDPSGTEVFNGGFDSREYTRRDVKNIAVRAANGEDPTDPRPAGSPADREMTPLEKAKAALWAYDTRPTEGVDPGMQSMRFHETQRQRDKKLSSWLNTLKRETAERNRLVAAVSAARRAEADAATPKTPVNPETIKGAEAVLILNRGRAEWHRVKRVNRTTVTVDGGGGGMDDPKYAHGKVVGVRKGGQTILGDQEQVAEAAPSTAPDYDERPGDPGDGPFRRGASKLRRAGVEDFTPNQARQVDEMSRDQWEAAQARMDAGESVSDVLGSTATRNRRDPMAPPSASRDEVQRLLAERRAAREAAARTSRATSSWDSYDEDMRPQTAQEEQENALERERQRADRDARIQREARSAQAEQESYMTSLRTRPQFSQGSYNREAVILALVEGNPIQQVFGRDRQAAQDSLHSIVRSFKPTAQERATATWGNDQRIANKVKAYDDGVVALRNIYNIDDPDLQRGASIGDTPAPRATNVPAGQSEDRTSKTAINIGTFGVRSEAEARQMYANTPRRDIADIPKGGNGHIGNGVWVKRCPVCGQAFKSVGAPGYSSTYARHVDGHNTGAAIPGYNVGMLS